MSRSTAASPPRKEGYVEINGNRTFYVQQGEGPPVILVHGWSLDVDYWRLVMDLLVDQFRVLAYDLRGMGRSAGGEKPYRFSLLVDDLEAVRRTFEIERPLICGHSLGGDITAQYAVTYPAGLAAGYFLLDAPGRPNLVINPVVAFLMRVGLPLLKRLGVEQPLALLVPLLRVLFFSRSFRRSHPEALAAWRTQFLASNVRAIVNALAAEAYRRVLALRLRNVKDPTVVARGSVDRIVSQRQASSFVRRIPNATFRSIQGSGHMSLVEKPREVAELIRDAALTIHGERRQ